MASEFKFDLNRVKYREILEFGRRDPNAPADPKTEKRSREIIARCLVEWPFDAEISEEALLDLGLRDYLMLQQAFNKAIEELFREQGITR